MTVLKDVGAERAVLSAICQYGIETFHDVNDIVQNSTFTVESNSAIYACLKHLVDSDVKTIDIPSIYGAASTLDLEKFFAKKVDAEVLQALFEMPVHKDNARQFAAKIRTLEISRLLHNQLALAQDKLHDVTGEESISHILGLAEDTVFDFTSLLNDGDASPKTMGSGLKDYLTHLGENPTGQLGISTGFPKWDASIGGGLRPATLNVIAARPKVGKTVITDNIGYHIAKKCKLPVLNLDTEMTWEDHAHRTLAMMTETNIHNIETGKFYGTPDGRTKIFAAQEELDKLPYYHKSIAGVPFEDQVSIMRRWITKEVGLDGNGVANPCVIIYDYLKLMDTQGLAQIQEYQLLGFMMTTLHNFAVRYKVPMLLLMQLNRDGITKEGTEAASGSDRIIWLCSNFTIFKNKSDEEIVQDGPQEGNKKLVTVVTRHGQGLDFGDYINCDMKGWCAKITEGRTRFDIQENAGGENSFEISQEDEIPFD